MSQLLRSTSVTGNREPAAQTCQLWRYYDTVAHGYDRTWAALFTLPATDLLALLGLPQAGRVLDVGTGTGVALLPAREAVGPAGVVLGLDPAVEMLRLARSKGGSPLAAAVVPGMPFADGSFDGLLANFVLSHLADYVAGLSDMVRVLRPGGRLGVTAWGPGVSAFSQLWQEIAGSFVNEQVLLAAGRLGPPWEQWFSDRPQLQKALEDAGLVEIQLRSAVYEVDIQLDDYLLDKETSLKGRAIHQALSGARWKRFLSTVANEFRSRFGDSITYASEAHLGVGTRP